jgi:hypothetical protein
MHVPVSCVYGEGLETRNITLLKVIGGQQMMLSIVCIHVIMIILSLIIIKCVISVFAGLVRYARRRRGLWVILLSPISRCDQKRD